MHHKVLSLQHSKDNSLFKLIAAVLSVFNKALLATFSMEAFLQAVTFGVSTAKSGPRQTRSPCRELLTLALMWSFLPKSRTDGVVRDSAEMEQEIVVLRKVRLECLSAVTAEWAAGSCLALNLSLSRMWTTIIIQGSASPLWF